MTVKAKFSNEFHAKLDRIKRLPILVGDTMMGSMKSSAVTLIQEFQSGIRMNDMGLKPLQPGTVASKQRKGYDKPENPLYGVGDRSDKSYINLLRIRQLKNGYKVYPSKGRHHSSSLPLNVLFEIHEKGITIVTRNGVVIRIPPRPAFFKAYERTMNKMKKDKRETSRNVKKAMTQYVNNAREDLLREIKKGDYLNSKDYEKND